MTRAWMAKSSPISLLLGRRPRTDLPAVVAFTVLCGLAAGCESGTATPGPSAMRHPSLEDFPVPNGFSLVDDRSRSWSPGTMRVVQYEFSGTPRRYAVKKFFEERLPAEGWRLQSQRVNEGTISLRFESDTEECDIDIRKKRLKTVFNVNIGPLPRNGPVREAPARTASEIQAP